MIVNFVGSFSTGYVGEVSDESHLAQEIEALGHVVHRIPRDEWREHVLTGKSYPNVPGDLKADINLVAKWNGFNTGEFIKYLSLRSGAPVFYWVWDYMQGEDWHMEAIRAADLYISNDIRSPLYKNISNAYYFPFDVSYRKFDRIKAEKNTDVTFFGSWIAQGDRQKYLVEINKHIPMQVFSWNWKEWPADFEASPAVYGTDFAQIVAETKICLGFSVDPHTWGYWSNRTGKILTVGGFLLYQYAPGMELFLRDGAEYFSSIEELKEKIDFYLIADTEREAIAQRGYEIGRDRFTSAARIKELMILTERFIKKGSIKWQI